MNLNFTTIYFTTQHQLDSYNHVEEDEEKL